MECNGNCEGNFFRLIINNFADNACLNKIFMIWNTCYFYCFFIFVPFAFYSKFICWGKLIGILYDVSKVSHIELPSIYLPFFINSYIIQSLLEGWFKNTYQYFLRKSLLNSSKLFRIKLEFPMATISCIPLDPKKKRNLNPMGSISRNIINFMIGFQINFDRSIRVGVVLIGILCIWE